MNAIAIGQWISGGLAALCAGVGAYAAVRAKIAALDARMRNAERDIERAHTRIDHVMENHA